MNTHPKSRVIVLVHCTQCHGEAERYEQTDRPIVCNRVVYTIYGRDICRCPTETVRVVREETFERAYAIPYPERDVPAILLNSVRIRSTRSGRHVPAY